VFAKEVGITRPPPGVDADVTAVDPAQLLKPPQERRQAGSTCRIVLGERHEHADAPHPFALLRARRHRPRRRAAAPPRSVMNSRRFTA
jgi:hypothetical protein